MENINDLITKSINAAINAGILISENYNTAYEIEQKSDNSPLTIADKLAHDKISEILNSTGYPILSEEGKTIDFSDRKEWITFWMVDPLDGTKEFIKRNGEFTVNIALINNGIPILGVVYAPCLDELYLGAQDLGAYKIDRAEKTLQKDKLSDWKKHTVKLPIKRDSGKLILMTSRSHLNSTSEGFLSKLKKEFLNTETISKGSSLKLCLIASGEAHIYPRLAPTYEWDTAAADAIVRASGGRVLQSGRKEELNYNKSILLNPWFVACSESIIKNDNKWKKISTLITNYS